VRVLGEDLVLFRDDQGRPGLLGLRCSHRLTSLAYGRVEDGGIRCPFHGWVYDVNGYCLEQPAEPEGSTFKDRVRHPSYPCQDLGGLIFAYMGPPEKQPLLPRYEVLVREDGTRRADYYNVRSNYLQHVEGALDTVHFSFLHQDNWSKVKGRLAEMPRPKLEYKETEYGIWQKSWLPSVQVNRSFWVYTYFFFPAGFLRVQDSTAGSQGRIGPEGGGDTRKFMSFYVPIDDTHTRRYQVFFAPTSTHEKPFEFPAMSGFLDAGPENDYFRDYDNVDTITGLRPYRYDSPAGAINGFRDQDTLVNESQGDVVERARERLGAHDHVLSAMRLMMLKAVQDVQAGRDPKHIIRDPEENDIVYIRGEEALEAV
jgi:phenylpropionate dioxygenase-like ring-hydroxylating dioxygenase large terminal subunit